MAKNKKPKIEHPKGKRITELDKKFVHEYLKDMNCFRAAVAAGYKPTTASSKAFMWVSQSKHNPKPEVRAYFEKLRESFYERIDCTIERCLLEYKKLAFADLSKAYDKDGQLLPIHEMPEDVRAALQAVESDDLYAGVGDSRVKIGITRKIKLAPKRDALQDLMRHMGGFEKDHKQAKDGEASLLVVADIKDLPIDQKAKILQKML